MAVYLIVEFFIQADKLADAELLFAKHIEDGRQDRGNLMFTMLRDPENPTRFTSLECWESRADVDHHDAQPHHPVFLRKLTEIQAKEKQVRFLKLFEPS